MATWDLDEETIKTVTADTAVNYGLDVVITQADSPWQPTGQRIAPSARHLVVAGDRVTVRGIVRNSGKDIRIFARQIILEADAVIDVSGPDPDAATDYQPGVLPEQKDASPGAKGADGNPGGRGVAAGNIFISAETISCAGDLSQPRLLAVGGCGGRGQDGHPGNQGAQGAAGNSGEVIEEDNAPGDAYGQKGGKGGSGGASGPGGVGGNGGQIALNYMSPPVSIPTAVGGGAGGAGGVGGDGGQGGEGGGGGTWYYEHWVGAKAATLFFPPLYKVKEARQAPGGSRGDAGAKWAAPPVPGTGGSTGAVLWNGGASVGANAPDYARLTASAAVKQLLITQHAASNDYLNAHSRDDYARPVALFIWLGHITAAVADANFVLPAEWTKSDAAAAKGIHDLAQVMLARLRSGLDFYGYPKDWVPIVTLQSYVERINQLISIGAIVEAQYNAFIKQDSTQEEQIAALKQMRASLQGDLATVADEINTLAEPDQGLIAQADKLITDLTAKIQTQQNLIATDEYLFTVAFKQFVLQKSGCDRFLDVLQTVGAIVAIGSSAIDGVGALTGAAEMEEAEKAAATAFQTAARAIKRIKTVLGSIDDIRKNLDVIKGTFPADPSQKDIALLATDKEKFDTFIDQYADEFGAAQNLKEAVDDYFAMIDARNQAILSYAALFTQMAKLQAQSAQLTAQIEDVDPDPTYPSLVTYLSFMRAAYTSVKADLTSRLFEAYRAKAYWTLENDAFSGSDLDIATLATTFNTLLGTIDQDRLRQGGPLAQFSDVRISIRQEDYPLAFRDLPPTKKLVFRLAPVLPGEKSDRPDRFSNQYQVLANTFTVDLPDIKDDQHALTLSLEHCGREVQVGMRNGNAFLAPFVHTARKTPFKIDYGDPGSKNGGQIGDEYFYGLSPFSVWTLDFDFPGNDWIDLSKIRSVDLVLSGNYVGPNLLKR